MSRTTAVAVLSGLLLALVTFAVAIGLAGGGHGWNTPVFVSLLGIAFFPSGLWVALRRDNIPRIRIIVLLCVAIASDLLVILLTSVEGWEYFANTLPFNLIWLSLWLSWQVPIFHRLGQQ